MEATRSNARRLVLSSTAYLAMLCVSVGLFFLIRTAGNGLVRSANREITVVRTGTAPLDVLPHVLLSLLVIIAIARLVGWLFLKLHQPAVIGEVVAGIALGPSLLGWLWPGTAALLFPAEVAPFLNVLAQVGVILFMFVVGLELDTDLLRHGTHSSIAISHASIVAPFPLGSAAALWLYPGYSVPGVSFTVFSLFLGVSLSVTAFPVLARILTDRGMQKTKLGVLALTCAAVDDVTAWCLLALLVSVAGPEPGRSVLTVGLTLVFIATVIALRPQLLLLVRRQESRGPLTRASVAVIFMALLAFSLTTEWIGIHALFGAFLLGAVIPHDSLVATQMREKLEDVVLVLLLPVFFAFTGLRTHIGLIQGLEHWLVCGFIIVLASVGKFGGSYVAARFAGQDSNTAASIGVLMNTRGLMELIVLNLGLDLGILSADLFAMFVIMAIVTTMATAPILHYLSTGRRVRAAGYP